MPKEGRTNAFFFSPFLDVESSGVWAGYWHYLKKLLANSIYSSHVPLRVQGNSVYLDVAERLSSAIIDHLFGATLNSVVSVSAGKWNWNRSLSLVSSPHILVPCKSMWMIWWVIEIFFYFFLLLLVLYSQYVCFNRDVVLGFFSTGVIPGLAYHSSKQAVLPTFGLGLYE